MRSNCFVCLFLFALCTRCFFTAVQKEEEEGETNNSIKCREK